MILLYVAKKRQPKLEGVEGAPTRITDDQRARNLLRAAILALLKESPSHGYGLVKRLEELGFEIPDLGGLYRVLRVMDEEGLVRSDWATGGRGPARRVYVLAPAGERYFLDSAQALVNQRRTIGEVLDLYRGLVRGEVGGPDRSPRVLVVEDDDDLRNTLWVLLEQHGWVVDEVPDGEAALELVGRQLPDIAVLDQRLPGMSGLDLARQLREDDFEGPIVLYSAYLNPPLEDEAAILGLRTLAKTDVAELVELLDGYRSDPAAGVG